MKRALCLTLLLLAGCSSKEPADLRQFVQQAPAGLKGSVEPMPPVRAYQPFVYPAGLPDPFAPLAGMAPGADRRPRQPLESYALEQLKFVGTLSRPGRIVALIRLPDGQILQAETGQYMGQNAARIARIDDDSLWLIERAADQEGRVAVRTTRLAVQP